MKRAKTSDQPWSFPVALDDVPDSGAHFDITAAEEARQDIARLAQLRSLPKLEATFDVSRQGDGLRVTGRAMARVGQTCVVTLEPIENDIDEPIDLVFSPSAESASEAAVSAPESEPPELLVNGTVDLGAIATEFFLLGIDPYPRKEGVEFERVQAGPPPDPSEHPFAALAALKKTPPA